MNRKGPSIQLIMAVVIFLLYGRTFYWPMIVDSRSYELDTQNTPVSLEFSWLMLFLGMVLVLPILAPFIILWFDSIKAKREPWMHFLDAIGGALIILLIMNFYAGLDIISVQPCEIYEPLW